MWIEGVAPLEAWPVPRTEAEAERVLEEMVGRIREQGGDAVVRPLDDRAWELLRAVGPAMYTFRAAQGVGADHASLDAAMSQTLDALSAFSSHVGQVRQHEACCRILGMERVTKAEMAALGRPHEGQEAA